MNLLKVQNPKLWEAFSNNLSFASEYGHAKEAKIPPVTGPLRETLEETENA